jgi:hypothetical protein
MVATGPDRATGHRGCDLHVFLPQKKQTIKGFALARDVTGEDLAALIARRLKVDLSPPRIPSRSTSPDASISA